MYSRQGLSGINVSLGLVGEARCRDDRLLIFEMGSGREKTILYLQSCLRDTRSYGVVELGLNKDVDHLTACPASLSLAILITA